MKKMPEIMLEEYERLYQNSRDYFMERFVMSVDDEVFLLKNYLRTPEDWTDKTRVFACYEHLENYIKEQHKEFHTNIERRKANYNSEYTYPQYETIWWNIKKEKLIDGEYQTVMEIILREDGELRTTTATTAFKQVYQDEASKRLYEELEIIYMKQFHVGDQWVIPHIILPFQAGDILWIKKDLRKKRYAVCIWARKNGMARYILCALQGHFGAITA